MDCQRLVFHILSKSLYYSTVENRQTFYMMLLWVMTKQLSIFSHSKQPQQVFFINGELCKAAAFSTQTKAKTRTSIHK